jgi:hypothetical protein
MGGQPIGSCDHRDIPVEEISPLEEDFALRRDFGYRADQQRRENQSAATHFNRLEQYVPICPGLPSASSSIAIITVAAQRCRRVLAGSMSIAFIRSGSAAFRFFCPIFVCALAISDEADGRTSLASLDTTSANAGDERLAAATAMQAANRIAGFFISSPLR